MAQGSDLARQSSAMVVVRVLERLERTVVERQPLSEPAPIPGRWLLSTPSWNRVVADEPLSLIHI